MSCQQPHTIQAIAAGPVGATGPTGASGVNGATGATGATGLVGPAGVFGVVGIGGGYGSPGVTGVRGFEAILAYHTGAYFNPGLPYYTWLAGNGDEFTYGIGQDISFGKVNYPSGEYLFHMNMNLAWTGNQGDTNKQCEFAFYNGYGNTADAVKWTQIKTGASGHGYGTIAGYSHWFIANVTNGKELFVSVKSADSTPLLNNFMTYRDASMEFNVYAIQGKGDNLQFRIEWVFTNANGSQSIYGGIKINDQIVVFENGPSHAGVFTSDNFPYGSTVSFTPLIRYLGHEVEGPTKSVGVSADTTTAGDPKANGFLAGAQLAVFNKPAYIINSPGFQ